LVTDMGWMFDTAKAFDQNLCSWNIRANADTQSMFVNSNCPNQDTPTASAVCQSCDRRRPAATAIAIDTGGKQNKPANNDADDKNNS